VASKRHTPRPVRVAVLTAVPALLVGLLPSASDAAPNRPTTPKTAAEAAQKVREFGQQLEILSEQVNDAGIAVGRLRVAAVQAAQTSTVVNKQYDALSGQVSKVVSAVYKLAPFGEVSAFLSSDSPQDFLDQIAALDRVSKQRGRLVNTVTRLKARADQAKADADRTLREARAKVSDLLAKKASMSRQIVEYRTLYDRLSAQELAVLGRADRSIRISIGDLPSPDTPAARAAVEAATSVVGKPYVWAASGPASFDCSGLTMWAWQHGGIALPHSSAQQYNSAPHVSRDQLAPGDLLFFYSPIHHVGLYVGPGLMIHAPTSGDVVRYAPIDWPNFVGASRPG